MQPSDKHSRRDFVRTSLVAGAATGGGHIAAAAAAGPTLAGIDAAVGEFVADGAIAGAVTVVADRDGFRHLGAVGRADIATDRGMPADAIFWIASMTKPVTGVAVMMLVDEGRLRLEDPIAKHLPAFAGLTDPSGRPATITLAHALTHTSGLGDIPRAEAQRARSLEALLEACLEQPLRFSPGSRWAYCQTGINAAARVVEVVSGERFQDFLDKRLFVPLGMRDTTFFPDAARRARLATTYRLGREGKSLEADRPGLDVDAGERVALANGGLFSTGPDYARFARMLLAGGVLDGRRYLSPEAVRTLAADQTGPLAAGFVPGSCWGIATAVVREPQGVTATLSPGTFGHGGAYGTQAWIDPVRGVAQILLFQRSDIGNSDGSPMRRRFHEAVARSLGWT